MSGSGVGDVRRRAPGRLTVAVIAMTAVLACALGTTMPAGAAPKPTRPGHACLQAKPGVKKAATPGKCAGDPADDAHAAAALLEAARALQAAETELAVARKALATARVELAEARAAADKARTDLLAAQLAEQRAARELAAIETSILAHQDDLGRLARSAYQSDGQLGEWALVLDSDTPEQLADRLAFIQSIASVGNAVISDLDEDRADLESAQARLAAARERQEVVAAKAMRAVAEKAAKERAAAGAERQVDAVVRARRAAVEVARRAQEEDVRRYQVMVAQSGQLGERIVALSAKLARSKPPPKGTGKFVRPGTGSLTSPYGPRFHPILHYVKVHTGSDFSRGDGLVYAADAGTVLMTELNVAYGNMTVVDHGTIGGLRVATLYAHQAAFAVKPGDRVGKGQPIGVIGSTGYSTGPHLHFEVRINGKPLDPAPFLVKAPLPPRVTGVPTRH